MAHLQTHMHSHSHSNNVGGYMEPNLHHQAPLAYTAHITETNMGNMVGNITNASNLGQQLAHINENSSFGTNLGA